MATAPHTDDNIGLYIRDMLDLGTGQVERAGAVPAMPLPGHVPEPEGDAIQHVDDSDLSNLRIVMDSGAVFAVRIIREG